VPRSTDTRRGAPRIARRSQLAHLPCAEADIYAFVFGQRGLMAGLGIQGNKIEKIQPK
jgi:hypothetical protein